MRIACCITKATDTHSEYVMLIAFPLQEWLRERASVLRYTYMDCLVKKRSLPFETSRLAVGFNQPPAAQVLGALPYRVHWPGHFHLVLKLGKIGAQTTAPPPLRVFMVVPSQAKV